MAKNEPAMRPSAISAEEVLSSLDPGRQEEAQILIDLCQDITGEPPQVWANRIIGFGQYEYRHESGRTGMSPLLGFASNARQHTVYLANDFAIRWPQLVEKLGKHRSSKVCLYLPRLTGIDLSVLRQLLELSLPAESSSD